MTETSQQMRKHDPFLKRLYKAGAHDAVALFFPELAAHIDWEQIQWIDKEVPIEGEGTDTRAVIADLLCLTRDVEGRYLEVLLHPELQMAKEADMDWRALQYNAGTLLQRGSPDARVLTFVFYHCGGAGGIQKRRYALEFYGEPLLEVGYWSVGLGDLNAEEYAEKDNPMAWALASWMRKPRKGRVQLRLRLVGKILRFVREPRYRRLLLGTVRTYFTLSAAQKAEEERLLQSSEYGEVREMFQSEFDKFEEEVERRAVRQAKQEDLLQLLVEKFGSVPEWASARVRDLEDTRMLDRLMRKLIHADSLEAVGL